MVQDEGFVKNPTVPAISLAVDNEVADTENEPGSSKLIRKALGLLLTGAFFFTPESSSKILYKKLSIRCMHSLFVCVQHIWSLLLTTVTQGQPVNINYMYPAPQLLLITHY